MRFNNFPYIAVLLYRVGALNRSIRSDFKAGCSSNSLNALIAIEASFRLYSRLLLNNSWAFFA